MTSLDVDTIDLTLVFGGASLATCSPAAADYHRDQRARYASSGTLIGAGVGVFAGTLVGQPAVGAIIGAAGGAIGGGKLGSYLATRDTKCTPER